MAEIRRLIARIAPTDATALITGETGTGKEVVARAIHGESDRRDRPFVAVNCGSIPETLLESELFGHAKGSFTGADREHRGLLEAAADGTLLLDEIGEMPLLLQPKLLRAIECREYRRVGSTSPLRLQSRILASTHRDLKAMTASGLFRPDLYYRLCVVEIEVPPLRRRPQDILPIAEHLLQRLAARLHRPRPQLEPEAVAALERYSWPGNVRELANVLERALILTDSPRLHAADLPGFVAEAMTQLPDDLKAARHAFEQAHIRRVIEKFAGDKRRAAEALGVDVSSLYRKLEE
jgi:DNA-binding NtrC family response regulator